MKPDKVKPRYKEFDYVKPSRAMKKWMPKEYKKWVKKEAINRIIVVGHQLERPELLILSVCLPKGGYILYHQDYWVKRGKGILDECKLAS